MMTQNIYWGEPSNIDDNEEYTPAFSLNDRLGEAMFKEADIPESVKVEQTDEDEPLSVEEEEKLFVLHEQKNPLEVVVWDRDEELRKARQELKQLFDTPLKQKASQVANGQNSIF